MENKSFERRRKEAFDRLETLVTTTTAVSVTGTLTCALYVFTRMDALVLFLVAVTVGAAATLLANAAMGDFYRRYVDGPKKGNPRPGGRQGR